MKDITIRSEDIGQLDTLKGQVLAFHGQVRKSWNHQMGYAFLCGLGLIRVKELLPHGSFMDWYAANLDGMGKEVVRRYMGFAAHIGAELKKRQITHCGEFESASMLLLTDGQSLGALTAQHNEELMAAVRAVCGGKSLTDLYREIGLLEKPALPGFRPDARALQGWLKKHCPELAGQGYEELPADVQRAFRKQYKPRVDPQIEIENYKETWREVVAILQDLLDNKKARGALDVDGDAETIKLGAEVCGDAAKFLRELVPAKHAKQTKGEN